MTGSLKSIVKYARRHWFIYALLLPGLCFCGLFSYGPFYGLILAFKDLNLKLGIWNSPWVGFENFKVLLTDPYFYTVVSNTVIINVYNIIIGFPFTVFLALMLSEIQRRYIKSTLQTAVYLPYFISWVVFAGIIRIMLNYNGIVNQMLESLFGTTYNFLTNPRSFRLLVVAADIIKSSGYGTIIYLAAIAGVNPELYESAKVDGANRYHMIRHITLPRIFPSIAVLLIMRVANLFGSNFDQIFNLYNPLVYKTGDVLSTYIYRTGLGESRFEVATAQGMIFSVLGLFTALTANRFIKRMNVMSIF